MKNQKWFASHSFNYFFSIFILYFFFSSYFYILYYIIFKDKITVNGRRFKILCIKIDENKLEFLVVVPFNILLVD
jgi:hypothetical protein